MHTRPRFHFLALLIMLSIIGSLVPSTMRAGPAISPTPAGAPTPASQLEYICAGESIPTGWGVFRIKPWTNASSDDCYNARKTEYQVYLLDERADLQTICYVSDLPPGWVTVEHLTGRGNASFCNARNIRYTITFAGEPPQDPGGPGGPGNKDLPGTECSRFTSTGRWGNLTVRDLLDGGLGIPEASEEYLDRTLNLNNVSLSPYLAYVQLKGTWCYKDGRVFSEEAQVQSFPTSEGGLLFDMGDTYAGQFRPQEMQYGQRDYLNESTKTDVWLVSPVKVNLTIPGTDIGIEIPAGTRIKVATIVLITRLSGHGNARCTQSGNPSNCDVESSWVVRY